MRRIKPDKMNTIVAMLCLALLGIFAGGVAGLCLPEHPQSSVCRSKFGESNFFAYICCVDEWSVIWAQTVGFHMVKICLAVC